MAEALVNVRIGEAIQRRIIDFFTSQSWLQSKSNSTKRGVSSKWRVARNSENSYAYIFYDTSEKIIFLRKLGAEA